MGVNTADDRLKQQLRALQESSGGQLNANEIYELVRDVVRSMRGDLSGADLKILTEIDHLATCIRDARLEIASLRPDEISSRYIPDATDELDVIATATEDATNDIMEAAEKIETLAESMEGTAAAALTQAVTRIYEACSFQDITGQRISKVVATLRHIEQRVEGLVEAFGEEIEQIKRDPDKPSGIRRKENDKTLLSGPQRTGEGRTQAEIDALLAGLD